MLSKVSKNNYNLGTNQIKKYAENNFNWISIQDNLQGYLMIKNNNNSILIYDYVKNIEIKNIFRIRLNILDKYFWKHLDSFDQNNILISSKIRSYVITQLNLNNNHHLKINNFLGIGGEYYIYWPFVKYYNYIGISNHKSIISDANFNCKLYNLKYSNYLVDYNNIKSFPSIDIYLPIDILINISNIHQNQILWISNLNVNKLVIITCKPMYKKINFIKKYFVIENIKYYKNFDSWISVCICTCKKKNIFRYISLGSNCSITYQLNKFGLRTNSYPFDWTKVSLSQLLNSLESDFNSYENIQVKKLSENHLDENFNPTLLLENNFGIKFAHEINHNSNELVDGFIKKIKERIDRFKKLNKNSDKIKTIFIRIELKPINKNYFILIDKLIIQLEKYIDKFSLILIINYKDKLPDNINFRIIVFKFESFDSDWKMNQLEWEKILFTFNNKINIICS